MILATTRLTDALIISNVGASFPSFSLFISYSVESNCLSNHLFKPEGKILFKLCELLMAPLTNERDKNEDPNFSSPSCWRLKPNSVCITDFAFLDVQSVITIITPAIINRYVSVFTLPDNPSINRVSGEAPGVLRKILNDSNPANGTPIKFTRSFPAKAIAKAKVPTNTISLRMSNLNIAFTAASKRVQPTIL